MTDQAIGLSPGAVALPRYSECFVCGRNNATGLDVTFYYRHGRIEAGFTPKKEHAGYRDIVHGGVLAALLDEIMGWTAVVSRPVMCMAVEIAVRYKTSAKAGERLLAYGELVADKKRLILARGAIEREDGTVLCVGEGKFMPLPDDEQKRVIEYAGWGTRFDEVFQRIQESRRREG
ncbi:MAG TPA: PaaI family thioesterase [bacterium]|nr:PaaI family thioesterase [bacterium]